MDTSEVKKHPNRRLWVALIAVTLIVLVFGIGIYRYQWDGGVTRVVTRVVPYPAAIVDGGLVRYSDFQEDVRFLIDFYEEEKKTAAAGSVFPTEEEIKERVLDRMVKDRLAETLAKRYKITVTTTDVKEAYDSTILDQAALGTPSEKVKAEARAEKTLDELYGMSAGAFRSKILHPFLVRQQLEKAIREDEELNTEKKKKAEEALAAVRGGMDFSEAVLIYSEDPNTINTEGDRGMLGRGLLPPEVEEVAFGMEPHDTHVSDIVESELGYHILKVTDRQDQDGFVTHVQLEEILIKPISLDDYLEAQKKRMNVITFVQ